MEKKTLEIPCRLEYCNKGYCRCKAVYIIATKDILMSKTALAMELYAHTIWYYIIKIFFKGKPQKIYDHLYSIGIEDGGDYWWRQVGYVLTYVFIPSIPIRWIYLIKTNKGVFRWIRSMLMTL